MKFLLPLLRTMSFSNKPPFERYYIRTIKLLRAVMTTQQKHVRKGVGGFGKKSCVSTSWCEKARKHICVTDRHDMTLAVKVALNSNTTN